MALLDTIVLIEAVLIVEQDIVLVNWGVMLSRARHIIDQNWLAIQVCRVMVELVLSFHMYAHTCLELFKIELGPFELTGVCLNKLINK